MFSDFMTSVSHVGIEMRITKKKNRAKNHREMWFKHRFPVTVQWKAVSNLFEMCGSSPSILVDFFVQIHWKSFGFAQQSQCFGMLAENCSQMVGNIDKNGYQMSRSIGKNFGTELIKQRKSYMDLFVCMALGSCEWFFYD